MAGLTAPTTITWLRSDPHHSSRLLSSPPRTLSREFASVDTPRRSRTSHSLSRSSLSFTHSTRGLFLLQFSAQLSLLSHGPRSSHTNLRERTKKNPYSLVRTWHGGVNGHTWNGALSTTLPRCAVVRAPDSRHALHTRHFVPLARLVASLDYTFAKPARRWTGSLATVASATLSLSLSLSHTHSLSLYGMRILVSFLHTDVPFPPPSSWFSCMKQRIYRALSM